MTSNINPNNIDGTYPVAGQDNNSQGFRDNFTNTKSNFQYAADEITDLQNNVILKAALAGTTLDNDMLGSLVYNGVVADFAATRVAIGTVSGSQTINYALGHYQTLTTGGSVSLSFSNFPPSGQAGFLRIQVTVTSTAHTLTLPAAVSVGTTGIQGWNSNIITFGATGTYEFGFVTSNGGSAITIFDLNRPLNVYTNKFGYGTGGGNTVTQASSRTTGVTINAPSGAITLVSAAGNSSYTTFTVTNSTVAATDVVVVSQKSGTDKYESFVTAVGAGSFNITFSDVSGTTTEQPVFNFAVIKGSTS
jgi:hypothetical protein